jgi:hypothetical protein
VVKPLEFRRNRSESFSLKFASKHQRHKVANKRKTLRNPQSFSYEVSHRRGHGDPLGLFVPFLGSIASSENTYEQLIKRCGEKPMPLRVGFVIHLETFAFLSCPGVVAYVSWKVAVRE